MGGRFFDFDAARAARHEAPPPRMRVFGDTIDLPRTVPVAAHLAVERYGPDQRLTLGVALELLGILVGQDTVDRWVGDHPDLDEDDVIDLYYGAMRIIQANDPEPDAEGEAPAPEAGAPQPGEMSSSTGGSSKPTSDGSTALI